jgi:23S rRNA (cytidine1920-2'-O)/16S rRNA (cytidine1409-2'-O)-methyltransferase
VPRRRLDAELVRRGLLPSRASARAAVEAGRVRVSGAPAATPTRLVDPAEPVEVLGPPPRFVSRGGEKLDAALDAFDVPVAGRRALDAGASTGGFTDCLLQRGAAEVVAVDVGYGVLSDRIRHDPRVRVQERVNVRHLAPADIGDPVPLVVADLSFISLRTVLPALLACAQPAADLVLLVKPQFEAGRQAVSRGRGVIRDAELWRRALVDVAAAALAGGATVRGAVPSPLTGAEGNVEFLLHLRRPAAGVEHAAGAEPVSAGAPASPDAASPAPDLSPAAVAALDAAVAAAVARFGAPAGAGGAPAGVPGARD